MGLGLVDLEVRGSGKTHIIRDRGMTLHTDNESSRISVRRLEDNHQLASLRGMFCLIWGDGRQAGRGWRAGQRRLT
jgi:hypothetical protein